MNWIVGLATLGLVLASHLALVLRAGRLEVMSFLCAIGLAMLAVLAVRSALSMHLTRLLRGVLYGGFALFVAGLLSTYLARLVGCSDSSVPLTRNQIGPCLLFAVGLLTAVEAWTALLWISVRCDPRALQWRRWHKVLGWAVYALFAGWWLLVVVPLFYAWRRGVEMLDAIDGLAVP
jgi:hypothetical protein